MRRVRELIACARLLRATDTGVPGSPVCGRGAFSKIHLPSHRNALSHRRPGIGSVPRFDPFMRSMSYAQSEPPYL